ncbi:MAG: FHA domain-containing protein [Deltaproteobacteria bacterium]|nr:FHA domain-containing protein [Deltaproteobacteria bacterium]
MVNRGDGGPRRPAPPAARPGARPAPRPADDGEEKTSALNLAGVNLDDLDEMPMPSSSVAGKPMPKRPQPATRAFGDDDGNEKTSALNLSEIDLDDDEPPAKAPPARPSPPARPAPARPAPAAKRPAAPEEGNEKTAAINLDEIDLDALPPRVAAAVAARQAPANTLSKPAVSAKAPARAPEPPPAKKAPEPPPRKAAEPVVDKTMAVPLEELEQKRAELLSSRAKKAAAVHEPAAADRTFLVDDEDPPVVKAPPPTKLGASAAAAAAPTGASGGGRAASGAELEPKMIVRAGAEQGTVYDITKDLSLVGRGLDADVVINDASASRKHFNIVRTLSGWKLVDLGSGNGTKVNGTRVTEIALEPGMKIEAGGTTLEWLMEEPKGKSAAAAADAGKGVRQTVTDEPPPTAKPGRHPGTLAPGLGGDDDIAAGVKRRTLSPDGTPGAEVAKKRDPSRMKLDDDKPEGGKGGGGGGGEEKTSFADIAALEIDPGWESRRTKNRKEGIDEGEMVPVSKSGGFGPGAGKGKGKAAAEEVEEEEEAYEEPKKGGAGKKIAIAFGVVAVLGGGFVAADKFGGLGIIFDKAKPAPEAVDKPKEGDGDKPKEADGDKPEGEGDKPKTAEGDGDKPKEGDGDKPKTAEGDGDKPKEGEGDKPKEGEGTPPGEDVKKVAAAKADEGKKAQEGKQWLLAKVRYEEALKSDGDNDVARNGISEVQTELAPWSAYVLGLGLAADKKYPEALKELEKIADTAAIAPKGRLLHNHVVNQHAYALIGEAMAAYDKKDFAAAKAAIEKALAVDALAQDGPLLAWKAAIDVAMLPDADNHDVADPADPKGKTKAPPLDFAPFVAAYSKGNFQAALAFLDDAQPMNATPNAKPASKAAAAKAGAIQAGVYLVDGLLQTSSDGIKTGKAEEAIAALFQVWRADAFAGGGLKARVEGELANGFAALAKAALEAKDEAEAHALTRMALAFDANNAAAKAIAETSVKAAKDKIAAAKEALASDPDKAATLLLEAVRALPADDADVPEALKTLVGLATFE